MSSRAEGASSPGFMVSNLAKIQAHVRLVSLSQSYVIA